MQAKTQTGGITGLQGKRWSTTVFWEAAVAAPSQPSHQSLTKKRMRGPGFIQIKTVNLSRAAVCQTFLTGISLVKRPLLSLAGHYNFYCLTLKVGTDWSSTKHLRFVSMFLAPISSRINMQHGTCLSQDTMPVGPSKLKDLVKISLSSSVLSTRRLRFKIQVTGHRFCWEALSSLANRNIWQWYSLHVFCQWCTRDETQTNYLSMFFSSVNIGLQPPPFTSHFTFFSHISKKNCIHFACKKVVWNAKRLKVASPNPLESKSVPWFQKGKYGTKEGKLS